MLKVYYFTIDDVEYGTGRYNYDGKFFTTSEALAFIRENEEAGNSLHIDRIAFITEECVDPCRWEIESGCPQARRYSEYMSLN